MKNHINTVLIFIAISFCGSKASAQSGYDAAMSETLKSFAAAKSPDEFLAVANRFEQIGATAASAWEPLYYAAYSQLITGMIQENPSAKDQFFDKALELAESINKRSPENSEVLALKGYIQFMKMSVDPQNRLDLMAAAEASLEKAIALDPENPRPYFIKGQTTFYTPEFFGGGAKAAKPLLEKAMEKFNTFEPKTAFAPNWGKERAEMLLGQTK